MGTQTRDPSRRRVSQALVISTVRRQRPAAPKPAQATPTKSEGTGQAPPRPPLRPPLRFTSSVAASGPNSPLQPLADGAVEHAAAPLVRLFVPSSCVIPPTADDAGTEMRGAAAAKQPYHPGDEGRGSVAGEDRPLWQVDGGRAPVTLTQSVELTGQLRYCQVTYPVI